MIDLTQCGAFIAALRKEHGWTQKELATRLNVTDKAVSRWETGKGLPDAETLLGLSALFDVNINELLNGMRTVSEPIAEETLVDVLQIADEEKRKHRRLIKTVVLMACIVLLLFGFLVLHDVTDGGGKSLSSVTATHKARTAATLIESGRYEAAATHISFLGRNRRPAKQDWIHAMHDLFDDSLEVTSFTVHPLEEEDQFISGTAQLRVYDPEKEEGFTFRVAVALQDGIAFGRIDSVDEGAYATALASRIADALCTYNAG